MFLLESEIVFNVYGEIRLKTFDENILRGMDEAGSSVVLA